MIDWKSISINTPTNKDKHFVGSPETPYVSCIVWVCNPSNVEGGVPDVVRWDTKNKCWHSPDMAGKWIHSHPYKITHFIDGINTPSPTLGTPQNTGGNTGEGEGEHSK